MRTGALGTGAFRGGAVLVALVTTTALAACGSGAGGTRPGASAGSLRGTITVSAASSLGGAFEELSREFARRHPGTAVEVNPGSSTALVAQIELGAPADVFAPADSETMRTLVRARRTVGPPVEIARNRLTIVTKPGNPARIKTLADLVNGSVVALCAATVPCGGYAARALDRAGITIPESSITREADARATLGAVANGDADAAIVYVTDARAAGDSVATVAIPPAQNVIAIYPAIALKSSAAPRVARAFVRFLTSSSARTQLARFGFLPPQ